MAEHLASIFGTEKDRVNCPFYFKIGYVSPSGSHAKTDETDANVFLPRGDREEERGRKGGEEKGACGVW